MHANIKKLTDNKKNITYNKNLQNSRKKKMK